MTRLTENGKQLIIESKCFSVPYFFPSFFVSFQNSKLPLCLRRPWKTLSGYWKKSLLLSRSWAFMMRVTRASWMAGDWQRWWRTLWLTFLRGSITNIPGTLMSSSFLVAAELLTWLSSHNKMFLALMVLLAVAVSFEKSLNPALPRQVKLKWVRVFVCCCALSVWFLFSPAAAVSWMFLRR